MRRITARLVETPEGPRAYKLVVKRGEELISEVPVKTKTVGEAIVNDICAAALASEMRLS